MKRVWKRRRVLAVASGGGHWVQLLRVLKAFDGHDVVLVTVNQAYREDADGRRVHIVRDATRWDKLGLVVLALQTLAIVLRERPDVVFSTGAAPGCLAVIFSRLLGARTIWLDSIANVERMSASGRLVRRWCHLWLTQWENVADADGAEYAGKVF